MKGVLWVFQEIHGAAQGEAQGEKERLTGELSQLYMQLETGQISEAQFDEREKELLDRLDELEPESQEEGDDAEADDEPRDESPEGEGGKGSGS